MSLHLPNTRDLPRPAAQSVMLGSVGALLRAQYEVLRSEPVPDHMQALIRRLAEKDDSPSLMRGR